MNEWLTGKPADWLTDWQTEWMNEWMADWLTDWLTDLLTDSLTEWMVNWMTFWMTDWLTYRMNEWMTYWLTNWLADRLTECLNYRATAWLVDWLIDTCVVSFKTPFTPLKSTSDLDMVWTCNFTGSQRKELIILWPIKCWKTVLKWLQSFCWVNLALVSRNLESTWVICKMNSTWKF